MHFPTARNRSARSRAAVALMAGLALGGGLLAQGPTSAASAAPASGVADLKPGQFAGVNWADPRDNFADDAVVPSGLSVSDSYSTVYSKASAILRGFRKIGANTVRLPVNPYSVGSSWWDSYQGAIDAATHQGFTVILAYWEGTGQNKDGQVDDLTSWWSMWSTLTATYASNKHVSFEPMNEPHAYSLADWSNLAAGWIATYPSVPRDRIFVSGTGYDDSVTGVCADPRLNGTYLALHDYAYWGTNTYSGWMTDISNRLGSCAARTVVDEFGAPMTDGLDYNGSTTANDVASNNYIAFIQAMTDTVHSLGMGSVYWPGLRTGDSYSLTELTGTGTKLSLALNSSSGLDRIRFGWRSGNALSLAHSD